MNTYPVDNGFLVRKLGCFQELGHLGALEKLRFSELMGKIDRASKCGTVTELSALSDGVRATPKTLVYVSSKLMNPWALIKKIDNVSALFVCISFQNEDPAVILDYRATNFILLFTLVLATASIIQWMYALRLSLGSYSTAVAAARAYDTAVFYLRGPSARLNFPELAQESGGCGCVAAADMSAASIRKMATESDSGEGAVEEEIKPGTGLLNRPDLNKTPEPENSDGELEWDRNSD
uniref:AP2/ERF domain-containing protein n=1 Tax=Cannabis sativa TaxID=3483 RepID=A0A803PEP8_CANSA